jgi:hypothetical protein
MPSPDASGDEARTGDLELLMRFRPLLRYDRQYDYRVTSALGAVENPGNILQRNEGEVIARADGEPPLSLALLGGYPEGIEPREDDCLAMAPDVLGDGRRMEGEERYAGRLYGQVVRDGGKTWLQYWFWFYYNPKNLFGFGRHEGDWEMVQIELGADGTPTFAAYAQHTSGEIRNFDRSEVEVERRDDGFHPVVYVASLSHASYFSAGTHPYPSGIDHAYGDGPSELLPVELPERWVKWPGYWGSSAHVIAGRLGNGPQSPARQGNWKNPAGFQAKLKRRRLRSLVSRLFHRLGEATYPPSPAVRARLDGRRCLVEYELGGRGRRRSRHLYLTVHAGERVIASRALRQPPRSGAEVILLPEGTAPNAVWASAFNRLRQRSELTQASI